MKQERLAEILKILLAKDESVENAEMLEEIRKGFEEIDTSKITELQTKYDALQQKYIDTFKSVLDKPANENTPPVPKQEEVVIPPDAKTTFEDIFIDEKGDN